MKGSSNIESNFVMYQCAYDRGRIEEGQPEDEHVLMAKDIAETTERQQEGTELNVFRKDLVSVRFLGAVDLGSSHGQGVGG